MIDYNGQVLPFVPQTSCPFFVSHTFKPKNLCSSTEMTVHSPLLKDVPVGEGRYSYQTHASLVGKVYWAIQAGLLTPLTFARHRLSPWAAS